MVLKLELTTAVLRAFLSLSCAILTLLLYFYPWPLGIASSEIYPIDSRGVLF